MKPKKRLLLVFLLNSLLVFSQFPGKKSKEDFKAIDESIYKVGDTINFGQPMKGDKYQSIMTYERKTFLDDLSDVSKAINGEKIEGTDFVLANKDISKAKNLKIKYFKIFKDDSGNLIQYAIVPYNRSIYLAIPMNISISLGEIVSKNSEFTPISKKENKEGYHIKSFSPNFNVKLLSVNGNKNNQTVTIEVLISHKIVHQEICFNYGKNDAKLYDFEGNEYLAKDVSIGAKNSSNSRGLFGGYVCNKIPTNVPVKASITFKQILPDKTKVSFATITIGYQAEDGGNYEYGQLELTNLTVDWE